MTATAARAWHDDRIAFTWRSERAHGPRARTYVIVPIDRSAGICQGHQHGPWARRSLCCGPDGLVRRNS